jgi:hypothetical protein
MAIYVNYPSTTLHLADPSTNYTEVSPLSISIHGEELVYSTLNPTLLQIEDPNNGYNNMIYSTQIFIQQLELQMALSPSEGVKISNGNTLKTTQIVQGQLTSYSEDGQGDPFDMSFNSLTFEGVGSTEGQVVTADASGQPHWSSVPAQTLSHVLNAGADASFNILENLGGIQLKQLLSIEAPLIVGADISGILWISSETPSKVVDVTLATKIFSGNYLKVKLNNSEEYSYIQLFSP